MSIVVTGLVAFDEHLGSFSDTQMAPSSPMSRLIDSTAFINSCVLRTDNGPQLWRKFNTPLYKKFCEAHLCLETLV